jgi:hypothetical protein
LAVERMSTAILARVVWFFCFLLVVRVLSLLSRTTVLSWSREEFALFAVGGGVVLSSCW